MTFQKTISKSITTSNNIRQQLEDIQIKNPLKKDIFVNGIELILSAEFSKKGKLIILLNDVSVFDENDSEALEGYAKFPIPLGKILKRSFDIKVFAWNGTDTNSIKVSLNLSLGEELQPFNSQAVPLGKDVFNQLVSEGETLFELKPRNPSVETKLIDLKGYDKIIVTLTAPNPVLPPNEATFSGVWSSDPSPLASITDGDLSTKALATIQLNNTGNIHLDWGSIGLRHLFIKFQIVLQSITQATWSLETSDDDIVYNVKASGSQNGSSQDDVTYNEDCTEHSFRYVKVVIDISANGSSACNYFEIYDSNILGGTGALSFEIQDKETGIWIEYIGSAEFGTISQGVSAIIKQIGGINNIAISGKPFVLPSPQNLIRAKYTITSKGLSNAISILRSR